MKWSAKFFAILFLFLGKFSFSASGQILQIALGVDGLTCPMCSRGVEKSLLKLTFIEKVEMDLEKTEATIYVKKNVAVSLNDIVKKVCDAGFSTRFLKIQMNMAMVNQPTPSCLNYGGISYIISGSGKINLTGNVWLRIADKQFMNPREFQAFENMVTSSDTICSSENFREAHHVIIL